MKVDEFLKSLGDSAQADQIKMAMEQLAAMAWWYFSSLTHAGFSDEQAMRLVADWHHILITSSIPNGGQ